MKVSKIVLLMLMAAKFNISIAQTYIPKHTDVVISEIMADPTPVAGLPDAEFIELKNRSDSDINLQGWRLYTSTGNSGLFPDHTLPAGSFLIITSTSNATLFYPYGGVLNIPGFPSLTNNGTTLSLVSKEGITIHAIHYSIHMHQNEVKKDGGWTLEMIDPAFPCSDKNWGSSTSNVGGTPGSTNSINASNTDETPPALLTTFCSDSVTVIATFSEPLDSISASAPANYILNNSTILSVSALPPLFNQVTILLSTPLEKQNVSELKVSHVKDCGGNEIGIYNSSKVGLTEIALPLDLIINEILFDPRPDGNDYAEIYNRSPKTIDAGTIYIANRNSAGMVSSLKKIHDEPFCIYPGDHIVVTESASSLQMLFMVGNPENILSLSSLPSFPDDEGTVVLISSSGEIIDEVNYSDKWHFALISEPEGVALERLDPDGASDISGNWHSASSTSGYGTPTYKNSQNIFEFSSGAEISVSPQLISPDNNGMDDFATISYRLSQPGYMANIYIFNINGFMIRYLVKNRLLGLSGSWKWDGLDENNSPVTPGNYIVFTELFNLDGKKKMFKNVVAVRR